MTQNVPQDPNQVLWNELKVMANQTGLPAWRLAESLQDPYMQYDQPLETGTYEEDSPGTAPIYR